MWRATVRTSRSSRGGPLVPFRTATFLFSNFTGPGANFQEIGALDLVTQTAGFQRAGNDYSAKATRLRKAFLTHLDLASWLAGFTAPTDPRNQQCGRAGGAGRAVGPAGRDADVSRGVRPRGARGCVV